MHIKHVTRVFPLVVSLFGAVSHADLTLLITIDVETSSGCKQGQGCFPVPIEDRILGTEDGVA
ncbi:MAG: hypothetical protein R3F54_14560 [Alphaproteobacteria bacterium]